MYKLVLAPLRISIKALTLSTPASLPKHTSSFFISFSFPFVIFEKIPSEVYRTWEIANMGRADFIKQVESSEEFKILDRVTKHDATVDDALQKVIDMTMVATTVHGPNSLQGAGLVDYNVALALMELSQRLEPAKHGKLVEFISKLQKQTATDPLTGEPQKIQGDTLWTDLPSFGYTELETWYEFGGEYKGNSFPTPISTCSYH